MNESQAAQDTRWRGLASCLLSSAGTLQGRKSGGQSLVELSSHPEVWLLRCKISAESRAGFSQFSVCLGNPMCPRSWLDWRGVRWEEMPVSFFEREMPSV